MEGRSGSIKEPPSLGSQGNGPEVKRSSGGSIELAGYDETSSPSKVPRKFIANWRQACDRTRDRTKELLKRWRTVPNHEEAFGRAPTAPRDLDHPGWSVHVWTTWVSRFPSDESLSGNDGPCKDTSAEALAPIQRDKFSHFFIYLLDHDRDGFIGRKDFELLSERLRRFADWSRNSPEYLRLLEMEEGLIKAILFEKSNLDCDTERRIDLEEWLCWWARLVATSDTSSYSELPLWVKTIPRVLFLAINTSGSGRISKDELSAFYGSVVGLDYERINNCLDTAYRSLTSNGDHPLGWIQYQLVFANFLFGRGPFGPGEHLLGMTDSCILRGDSIPFPIDYSAMNTPKGKLEVYSPHCKTNRRSVVV
ncbi:uncharacterized protein LOC107271639 [Cephus cinctus]|uniref:Uncharacterized protein LOC107271639 n=1 Tax=Cephus cinctus TaxID=211228 RepID=A0AAJ7FQL2_CEPCN|nr:uncharacterized protein LOC107271639 [Cephus cinctus]